jgi:hypothetical protein
LNAIPAPTPRSSIPGSTSTTNDPATGARAKSARPTAAQTSPATSGARMPKRSTTRAEMPSEHAAMIRFDGRNARPTCIAL